jgi:hypothetical protein
MKTIGVKMTADQVYSLANWVLIGALVFGVIATFAVVVSGKIKDEKLARELKEKDGQIAEANARAEEAKLELAKFRAPRDISEDQRAKLAIGLKKFSGTVFDISGGDNETLMFALGIADTLTKAGWRIISWTGGKTTIHLPNRTFSAGFVMTTGVHIQIFDPTFSKASEALVNALKLAGFEGVQVTLENVPQEHPNRNVIHINVGPKP